MYFRFPDNPELTNFREYRTFAELFTPSVNRCWDHSLGNEVTLDQWFRFLKAFYSRENIRNNLGCFVPDMRSYRNIDDETNSKRYADELIADIPDDYLWMLHFLRYYEYSGTHYFHLFKIKRAESEARIGLPYVGLHTSQTIIEASSSRVLFDLIKPHAEALETYFNENANKTMAWDYWYACKYLSLYSKLRLFWIKELRYRDMTGGNSTMISLTLDSNAQITTSESNLMISVGYDFALMATRKVTRTYREPLYQVLNYSTNPCSILDWPIVEPGEHKPMLYGVELECTFDYPLKEVIDAAHTPFFIAKQDSSISGSKRQAAELVTVPMSLKALKRHYAHWFQNLDYTRFDVTKDTTNGMHVHMDRQGFDGKKHIQNLAWFYLNPANRDFLIYVSERGSLEAMNRYSPIAQFPNNMSKIKAYKRVVEVASAHRGIVNFGKQTTVEIRMFRGIVSFAELCKNLEFVDAVFQFTRGEKSLGQLSAAHFIAWLRKTPVNRYTMLKKFIDRCKNLDSLMLACEVYDEVFNITDPEKIKELLNKSKLQLTNAHVTILNRGKKRTFVLNKETGLLDVVLSNRSKLADVDRVVESRYTRNAFAA